MDFSKGVLFDPGYSKYTLAFATNIDAVYNVIFSMKAMHQRKFKFQTVYPQILKLIEHTVGFYLGCLLWASYISQKFEKDQKEILENDYLGKAVNEDEMLFEVNYAISYLDKLKKDCKYYLGKNCNIPDDWYQVMNIYKEFLLSNNFLVNTKNTSELKLPPEVKKLSDNELDTILNGIESVLKTGEFKELFKLKPLILS